MTFDRQIQERLLYYWTLDQPNAEGKLESGKVIGKLKFGVSLCNLEKVPTLSYRPNDGDVKRGYDELSTCIEGPGGLRDEVENM